MNPQLERSRGDKRVTPKGTLIWQDCPDCGTFRWVRLVHGEPRATRCRSCAMKLIPRQQHISEDHKRKIGMASKGRHPSSETIEKIRFANLGKVVSDETRMALSRAGKGRHLPESQKKNIALSHLGERNHFYGKHHSEHTKERMRLAKLNIIPKFKDTSIELRLQRALNDNGIEFETHKSIWGRPDIFIEPNLCIFCDGDYWHEREEQKPKDTRVNWRLFNQGYKVLRFWEHEINTDLFGCFNRIMDVI